MENLFEEQKVLDLANLEDRLVAILNILYSAAPKDHNRIGFESEFQSRVKACLNTKDLKTFTSKLIRKLGIKMSDIYLKDKEGVFDFSNIDDKRALKMLREELEYLLIKAKLIRQGA